jgi:DNA-binding HxlR family transcriptional regulator
MESRCAAFRAAMEILGKPWNGVLLRQLDEGPLRFSVLAEKTAIGDRMLSCRLKELEAAGLVDRAVDPGPPVRVSYALTPLGRGLHQVTRAVEDWGERLLAERGEGTAPACDYADEAGEKPVP